MRPLLRFFLVLGILLSVGLNAFSQDSAAVQWQVTSKKISDKEYELKFVTNGPNGWQLYAPNQILSEVATTELQFSDSAIQSTGAFKDSGAVKTEKSIIFEGTQVKVYEGATAWTQRVH